MKVPSSVIKEGSRARIEIEQVQEMANHGKIMEIGGGNPKRRVISQGELVKIVTTMTMKIRATKGVANGATFVAR